MILTGQKPKYSGTTRPQFLYHLSHVD